MVEGGIKHPNDLAALVIDNDLTLLVPQYRDSEAPVKSRHGSEVEVLESFVTDNTVFLVVAYHTATASVLGRIKVHDD